MDIETLLQKLDLGEGSDFECKESSWKLPKSIWETVSAFANTEGGYLVLGAAEVKKKLCIEGVIDPEGIQKEFWDIHNNSKKLSSPLCVDSDLSVKSLDGKTIIIITIPRARREDRPVYINENPYRGSFKRNFEGDYHCSKAEINQMLRDASEQPQDSLILEKFSLEQDIDLQTLKEFRQRFSSREPDHPWLAEDNQELLRLLGGWRRDRFTGQEGLTHAGLLMFGKESSILEAFPNHQLDYQERLSDDPEERWTYRLTRDGKWESNLYNFYFKVYSRLVSDLNLPFKLNNEGVRIGETHVHEALREALSNSIIHAAHQASKPLVVIKSKSRFTFFNPGRLRLPIEQIFEGGISDPRNPSLQKMFKALGIGDKAGSGFPKIFRAWREQCWYSPLIAENAEMELTAVVLSMVSLIPEDVDRELQKVVGNDYANIQELDRMVLVAAHQNGEIGNADIQSYRREHPRDIGHSLKRLVDHGWLEKSGHGRGMKYKLAGTDAASTTYTQSALNYDDLSSGHKDPSSGHKNPSSGHKDLSSSHKGGKDAEHLMQIALPVSSTRRCKPELLEAVLLQLCSGRYLTLQELAHYLNRDATSLRKRFVKPLIGSGVLQSKFDEINHPEQAYIAKR